MLQFKARPILMAHSTPLALTTGSAPGSPRETGSTWELGSAPKRAEEVENIFVSVASSTWTSMPITGSYFSKTSS